MGLCCMVTWQPSAQILILGQLRPCWTKSATSRFGVICPLFMPPHTEAPLLWQARCQGLLCIFSYVLTTTLEQGSFTNNPHLREKEPKAQRG